MATSDSGAIDAAIIAYLDADAALKALLPDGVFWGIAPTGKTRFVIVEQMDHDDHAVLHGKQWERCVYLIKAVTQDSSRTTARNAAARIFELMEDATALQLPVDGYLIRWIHRIERLSITEVDDETDLRWQHCGGLYESFAAPTLKSANEQTAAVH